MMGHTVGYTMSYPRSTLGKKSGRQQWYVYVTVPKQLVDLIGRKQLLLSTGTTDIRLARDKQQSLEAEIYQKLDEADLANHPLVKAAKALLDILSSNGMEPNFFQDYPEPSIWFDSSLRWSAEEELRTMADSLGVMADLEKDEENAVLLGNLANKIQPFIDSFNVEFRKLSEEKYAPRKRSKPFAVLAEEYFSSSEFHNNVEREKTKIDQKRRVATFAKWSGNIPLDDMNVALGRKYIEELAKPDSTIVQGRTGDGASQATVKKYISPIKVILNYAFNNGEIQIKPWDGLELKRQGRKSVERIGFSTSQLKELFGLPLPPRERLLFQILAATGCRLDEVALLTWKQISAVSHDGRDIPYIDLTGFHMLVKTETARRMVPIVPELWSCFPPRGYSPFGCRDETDRIFNYRKDTDGKAENKASRYGMMQVRGLIEDRRLVLHSFRHSFVTKCREIKMDEEMRNHFLGHSMGSGAGSGYGDAHGLSQFYDELLKIDWSFIVPQKCTPKKP